MLSDTAIIDYAYSLLTIVADNPTEIAILNDLQTQLTKARKVLSYNYFQAEYDDAITYYILHWFLVLYAQKYPEVLANPNNATSKFAINSASSQDVSINYAMPKSAMGEGRFGDDSSYNRTSFGIDYLAIKQQCYGGVG